MSSCPLWTPWFYRGPLLQGADVRGTSEERETTEPASWLLHDELSVGRREVSVDSTHWWVWLTPLRALALSSS